jgi:flagellar protein FliO/FliZ
MKLKIAVLTGLLLPSFAMAAESAPLMTSNLASYGKLLLGLVFVLGTFLGAVWIAKRSKIMNPGSAQLKVVTQISFGTKEKVALIEIEGERVLVGITQSNINLLRHYEMKKDDQSIPTEQSAPSAEVFKEKLAQSLKARISNKKAQNLTQ